MPLASKSSSTVRLARLILSATVLVLLCGIPYLRWMAYPSLFDDDFLRVGSLRRTSLVEALFRPFNEHMAPLFEIVTWLAWQGSGRSLINVPLAFMVASMLAFGVTVGLIGTMITHELRSRSAGLLAVVVFTLSAVSAETVLWFSASSFQWAASASISGWLAAARAVESPTRWGRRGWLAASGLAAFLAPGFSAIGVLAGPLGTLRILSAEAHPISKSQRFGWGVARHSEPSSTCSLAHRFGTVRLSRPASSVTSRRWRRCGRASGLPREFSCQL